MTHDEMRADHADNVARVIGLGVVFAALASEGFRLI